MNAVQIQQFLENIDTSSSPYVKINFRGREAIYGLFLTEEEDFRDLKSKNFWRVVTRKHFDDYSKTRNADCARIFNGSEFTHLSLLSDEF